MLVRNSLLISKEALRQAVEVIAKDKLWNGVICNGHSIAINSARRVIRLLMEIDDCDETPLLPTYSAPLHALYVLVVHLVYQPHSRMAKADVEVRIGPVHSSNKSDLACSSSPTPCILSDKTTKM
jgi:hypothetical protein